MPMEALVSPCPWPGYRLREARAEDVAAIVTLDRLCMKAHVERYYGPWDEANAERIVRENLRRARIVEFHSVLCGCYYWEKEEPATASNSLSGFRENL